MCLYWIDDPLAPVPDWLLRLLRPRIYGRRR